MHQRSACQVPSYYQRTEICMKGTSATAFPNGCRPRMTVYRRIISQNFGMPLLRYWNSRSRLISHTNLYGTLYNQQRNTGTLSFQQSNLEIYRSMSKLIYSMHFIISELLL